MLSGALGTLMLSTHEELCHGEGGAGIKVSCQSQVKAEIKSGSYSAQRQVSPGDKGHSLEVLSCVGAGCRIHKAESMGPSQQGCEGP